MAACKWEWHLAAAAEASRAFFPDRLSSAGQPGGEPTPLPAHPACLAAQRAWGRMQWQMRRGDGGAGASAVDIQQ